MVYIRDWSNFEQAATDLHAKAPGRVRYTIKFKPKTGHLVLKVTDDTTCIMYKTFSSIILNRFEALNLRLLSQISNVRPKTRPLTLTADSTRAGTPAAEDGDDPMGGAAAGEGKEEQASGPSVPSGGAKSGGGGGGKKKKKGKR